MNHLEQKTKCIDFIIKMFCKNAKRRGTKMNATEIINELHKEVGIIGGFNSVFTILITLTILICLFIHIKTENFRITFSAFFITIIILASVFIIELAFDTENSPCKKAINAAEENKIIIIYDNQTLDYESLTKNFSKIDWSYITFDEKDNKIILTQSAQSREMDEKQRLYNQEILKRCGKKENEI